MRRPKAIIAGGITLVLLLMVSAFMIIRPDKAAAKHESDTRSLAMNTPAMSRAPLIAHHVVIQIDQSDPSLMNQALNNAQNLTEYYEGRGEQVKIEFVAFGAGLSMVRSDISPVKQRLAALDRGTKNITFSGCHNTLSKQMQAENKTISLLPGVQLVPAGIERVVQLQEQGWTYVRP